MFQSPVSLHLQKVTGKTETNNDVSTAVTHVGLVLDSLTPELAAELSEDIEGLCFDADGQIRDEVTKLDIRLREKQQYVTAKMALDVKDPSAVLRHVRVLSLGVTKRGEDKGEEVDRKSKKVAPTAETLRATLNLLVVPDDPETRKFLLCMVGKTFVFAFEDEAKQLDFGPAPDADDDDDGQEDLEFDGPRLKGKSKKDRPISDAEIRTALKETNLELRPAHLKALSAQHREEILDWVRVCRETRANLGEACTFDDLPTTPTYVMNPAELGIAPAPDPAAGDILEDTASEKKARAPRRSSAQFKNSPRVVKTKKGGRRS